MMIPVLLISVNFERMRYAAAYSFPLLIIGGFLLIFSLIGIKLKFPGIGQNTNRWIELLPLVISGGLNAISWSVIIALSEAEALIFIKSAGYLTLCVGAASGSFYSILSTIDKLSYANSEQKPKSQRLLRIITVVFFPLVLVVAAFWQGTSMIYSWSLADDNPKLILSIMNGLGWICVILAIIRAIKPGK
jgi:cytochrome bd-type quinol oxidase subunit 2